MKRRRMSNEVTSDGVTRTIDPSSPEGYAVASREDEAMKDEGRRSPWPLILTSTNKLLHHRLSATGTMPGSFSGYVQGHGSSDTVTE
jgi:hypothetical protein